MCVVSLSKKNWFVNTLATNHFKNEKRFELVRKIKEAMLKQAKEKPPGVVGG